MLASQQRETLSELSVEEVFNRRLALEELDESQQQRRHRSKRKQGGGQRHVITVSYTHLDVYKRQSDGCEKTL